MTERSVSDYERDKMQHTIAMMAATLLAAQPIKPALVDYPAVAKAARQLFDAVDVELCGLRGEASAPEWDEQCQEVAAASLDRQGCNLVADAVRENSAVYATLADSHAALQSQVRAFSEDRDALRVAIDAALNGLREDTIAAASHTRYPTDCQHPYCVLSRARSSLRSEGEPDT